MKKGVINKISGRSGTILYERTGLYLVHYYGGGIDMNFHGEYVDRRYDYKRWTRKKNLKGLWQKPMVEIGPNDELPF